MYGQFVFLVEKVKVITYNCNSIVNDGSCRNHVGSTAFFFSYKNVKFWLEYKHLKVLKLYE